MERTARIELDGKTYDFPVVEGTEHELAIDFRGTGITFGGTGGIALGADCWDAVTGGVSSSAVALSSRLGIRVCPFRASLRFALDAMSVS